MHLPLATPTCPIENNSIRRALAFVLLLIVFVLLGNRAWAFEAPAFQGDVLDEVGILSAEDQHALQQRIRELRDNSGIWAAVYVTQSLQQDAIESAAVTTFKKWKLGQVDKDNGLLVLIVPSERQTRIEVGYGLEGFITDAFSKRVIDEIYKPAFREQRFSDGLIQGFEAMAKMANGEPMPEAQRSDSRSDIDWSRAPFYFALTLGLNLLPGMLYLGALMYGRSQGRREPGSLWQNVRLPLLFGAVIGVFFGLFIAVFGAAFTTDPGAVVALSVMNGIFASFIVIPFGLKARRYMSAAAYRRDQARERLVRIRKRSNKAREIFGVMFDPKSNNVSEGGTRRETSSSSSSSSSRSSSSSSSGGGRSGGGGASGSW